MPKSFQTLYNAIPKSRKEAIEKRVAKERATMALREIRQAQSLTQEQLAKTLHVNQAAISKVEKQSDMYVSTLRRFLKAMGGELRIVAHFADRDVEIKTFSRKTPNRLS